MAELLAELEADMQSKEAEAQGAEGACDLVGCWAEGASELLDRARWAEAASCAAWDRSRAAVARASRSSGVSSPCSSEQISSAGPSSVSPATPIAFCPNVGSCSTRLLRLLLRRAPLRSRNESPRDSLPRLLN